MEEGVKRVGTISEPHGNGGIVKIICEYDGEKIIKNAKEVFLLNEGKRLGPFEVWSFRKHRRGQHLLKLNGFKTRGEVEKFSRFALAVHG